MAGPRRPPGKKPRSDGTSGRDPKKLSQRVKTARGRTLSSTRWLERQLNDPFVSRAKLEGYRSRSAFKLTGIDDEFHLLKPGGRFIHSNWQFLNSDRLRRRIQPWDTVGLDPAALEPGDYLLDWRQGGHGLRYVHHFEPDELTALAHRAGFEPIDGFYSDGEGGNLGLYQVWRKGFPETERP